MRGLTLQIITLVIVILGTSIDLALPNFSEFDIEGGDYDAWTLDDDVESPGAFRIGLDLDEQFLPVARYVLPHSSICFAAVDRARPSLQPDPHRTDVFRPPRSIQL